LGAPWARAKIGTQLTQSTIPGLEDKVVDWKNAWHSTFGGEKGRLIGEAALGVTGSIGAGFLVNRIPGVPSALPNYVMLGGLLATGVVVAFTAWDDSWIGGKVDKGASWLAKKL
jgi:hypothetical protein